MFTGKQIKELEEIKPILLAEVETPELPVIKFPNWLSGSIRACVVDHLEMIETLRNKPGRWLFDSYIYFVNCFNRIKPVFNDPLMQDIWDDLYEKSPEGTSRLIGYLDCIEKDFNGRIRLIEKHKDEVKSAEKMLSLAEKMHYAMEEYQCHYYGHVLQTNHNKLMNTLLKFIENTSADLDEFKDSLKSQFEEQNDFWPVTREHRSKNALPIFFIKKIYSFFKINFNAPMYEHVATITNVIFNTNYSGNDVMKHVKGLRHYSIENPPPK